MDAGRALATGELESLGDYVQRLRVGIDGGGGFGLAWLRYLALSGPEDRIGALRLQRPPRELHAEQPNQIRMRVIQSEQQRGEIPQRRALDAPTGIGGRTQHHAKPQLAVRVPQDRTIRPHGA
jgi:hypothetical protein